MVFTAPGVKSHFFLHESFRSMSRRKSPHQMNFDDDAELYFEDKPLPETHRPAANPTYRKTLQLCRQIEHQLSYALGCCADPLLGELTVLKVVPAPNAGRLLVTMQCPQHLSVAHVLERLKLAVPWLRTEIAPAIRRRRVPELTFVCAAADPLL